MHDVSIAERITVSEGRNSISAAFHKESALLLVLFGFSLALNVQLGWKLRAGGAARAGGSAAALSAGALIGPVTAKTLDGQPVTLNFGEDSRATVLYVFSPQCGWCDRNLANINTLARSPSYRVVGLSLVDRSLEKYLGTHRLDFPVYADAPARVVSALGLGSTPQTLVISPSGKLLKNWVGAYTASLETEINAYFGVKLPGVSPGGSYAGFPQPGVEPGAAASQHAPNQRIKCYKRGVAYSLGAAIDNRGEHETCVCTAGDWAR